MTFFGPDQVEQVKARADIVRVAERYTEPKKSGSHHVARCCFHEERSPSMHLYDDGRYHCYGCGAHGDVISLVQQKEHLTFQEAVERLARELGIQLEDKATKGPREDHGPLYAATEFAAALYERQLWEPIGADALAYLRGRKLSEETLRRFRVGWAGRGSELLAAATAAGLALEQLRAADLVGQHEGRIHDRFYGRIVVPILDQRGRPVAFTARILPADLERALERGKNPGKYVNTSETPIYRKGATVFNLYRAKGAVRDRKRLVVMEGALDVIAADQAGYAEAVAPCGTAITGDQAQLLATTAARQDVVLALDGDGAGQAALNKHVRALLGAGAAVRVAAMPEGADPAELLVEEATAETRAAFKEAVERSLRGLPWLLARVCPHADDADEPARLRALDDVIGLVAAVPDEDLRDLYLTTAAKHLGVTSATARKRATRAASASDHNDAPANPSSGARGSEFPQSRYVLNETGNAHRFLDRCGDDVRYCHTWGVWLVWRGTHWEVDKHKETERLMTAAIVDSCDEEIAALEQQAAAENEKPTPYVLLYLHLRELASTLAKWKVKNGNDRAIMNSLARAASLSDLGVTADQLDRDPWAFTVANGTLDLKTGALRPHKREDFITRLCSVAYEPSARNERWERFLGQLTAGDTELAAYLQRASGYAMSGTTKEDAVWMFAGTGGNGKSTFTAAVSKLLGSYARPLPFEIFLTSHSDKRKWSLAEASQCRLVVCEESEEGRRFNASLVKQVSGGTEIEAERKHGNPFTYQPLFKVWFLTNTPPAVSDTDRGFWRRMHLVRCDAVPEKPDPELRDYLLTDASARTALLAWAVAGAQAYAAQGLQPPDAVRNASAAYRAEQDQLRPFAEECLIFDETAEIPVRELMAVYKRWCEENQIKHPMSSKAMNQRLEARGVQTEGAWIYLSSIRKSVRGYQGVRLRTEHDPRQAEASPQMSGATRGETEANAADDGQSTLDEAIATQPLASDQPGAPGSPHVQDASRGDINPGAGADLPGIASDAQGPRVGAHAQEDFSPPNSLGEEKPRGGSVATRGRPDSRGRRLAGPPRPAEDVFSDPPVAPPPREPGAAEGETWPPPGEDPAP